MTDSRQTKDKTHDSESDASIYYQKLCERLNRHGELKGDDALNFNSMNLLTLNALLPLLINAINNLIWALGEDEECGAEPIN